MAPAGKAGGNRDPGGTVGLPRSHCMSTVKAGKAEAFCESGAGIVGTAAMLKGE
jgi:hypothetical protein